MKRWRDTTFVPVIRINYVLRGLVAKGKQARLQKIGRIGHKDE